ncbi:unnamed protein product [Penicillium pancosmium]
MDDVEEDTFIAFCEFAYRGKYNTPCREDEDNDSHFDAKNQVILNGSNSEQQSQTGPTPGQELEPEMDPEPMLEPEPEPEPETGPLFVYPFDSRTLSKKAQIKKYRASPPPEIEFAKSLYVLSPYERRRTQFEGLRFVGDEATFCPNPDFLAHAKIYVFATRYLVDPLKEQCLKSLHRDLCSFSLHKETTTYILDLLEYTYEQTSRQEPDGCYSIRMLVILYISCEMPTLIENTRFRRILDEHGEMASDLVLKLVK